MAADRHHHALRDLLDDIVLDLRHLHPLRSTLNPGYIGSTSAPYRRYIGPVLALYRLYIDCISAPYRLCNGSISCSIPAPHRLHIGSISAPHRAPHRLHIGSISAIAGGMARERVSHFLIYSMISVLGLRHPHPHLPPPPPICPTAYLPYHLTLPPLNSTAT